MLQQQVNTLTSQVSHLATIIYWQEDPQLNVLTQPPLSPTSLLIPVWQPKSIPNSPSILPLLAPITPTPATPITSIPSNYSNPANAITSALNKKTWHSPVFRQQKLTTFNGPMDVWNHYMAIQHFFSALFPRTIKSSSTTPLWLAFL